MYCSLCGTASSVKNDEDNSWAEVAVNFDCVGDKLFGVLHRCAVDASVGVLIVVGGRQFRVGAHRQFVMLARYLASRGIPVFRFDVRGMGDSEGQVRHFLSLDVDIAQAVAAFQYHSPTLKTIALWGLCDGASAAILSAASNSMIKGVMLVNPWISTDNGIARTYLKHYYKKRLFDPVFWRKVFTGGVKWRTSLVSLHQTLRSMRNTERPDEVSDDSTLPDIIFDAVNQYSGRMKIVISERDLTAREFEDEFQRRNVDGRLWSLQSDILIRISADHTFSDAKAHQQLCELTAEWLQSLRS